MRPAALVASATNSGLSTDLVIRLLLAAMLSALAESASAAALDDIYIEVSHDLCAGQGASDDNFIVYATNLAPDRTIDATFKFDSNPPQQHFILFDANLNPTTDRFPKSYARRVKPREKVMIGCTFTYRAAPRGSIPASVPLAVTKQTASYVDASASEPPLAEARAAAAFLLQGGNDDCGAGSKPPGLFYLVNLDPFANLSASLDFVDDRGTRAGALTHHLPPLRAVRVGCSNGPSRPGPITDASLEIAAGMTMTLPPAPEHHESRADETPSVVGLPLGVILRTQNVCAGPIPLGWIKINDAWNPTVCGKPGTIIYNVWTIQQLSDEPVGTVMQVCKGSVPSGWATVGASWNPTVCGHPAANQQNVMAIRRLN
jgi:hypothetical protein